MAGWFAGRRVSAGVLSPTSCAVTLRAVLIAAISLWLSGDHHAWAQGTVGERAQRALLKSQIAHLAHSTKATPSVFAIGVAGWASQDVFIKELDGGLTALAGVLPIAGRTLRLVNNPETVARLPQATVRSFDAAVDAVAGVMNKDADILLLLMTSHGSPNGFALQPPNGPTTELTPQEVAGALNKAGIKNRIVIVSACFSGIFLPPLADDSTVVLTAADSRSTSFGCAAERDWTYFGDAFFDRAHGQASIFSMPSITRGR